MTTQNRINYTVCIFSYKLYAKLFKYEHAVFGYELEQNMLPVNESHICTPLHWYKCMLSLLNTELAHTDIELNLVLKPDVSVGAFNPYRRHRLIPLRNL